MKIKIVGKSAGTSKKTGNPYCIAYFTTSKPNVEGVVADSVFVNPSLCPADKVVVGKEYNADYDNTGYLTGFYPV